MKIPRIYHPYWNWECYKSGFFDEGQTNKTKNQLESEFAEYFKDIKNFERDIPLVFKYWKNSCEQFLLNPSFNKVAWLGQACVCYSLGIPAKYRTGYRTLPKQIQEQADNLALASIKQWLEQYENRKNK